MTRLTCKTWAKLLAFGLCLIFTVLAALSGCGAYYAYAEGWLHGKQGFAQSQICRSEVITELQLLRYCLIDFGLTPDFAQAAGDSEVFTYVIRDQQGNVLLDTTGEGDELSYSGYTVSLSQVFNGSDYYQPPADAAQAASQPALEPLPKEEEEAKANETGSGPVGTDLAPSAGYEQLDQQYLLIDGYVSRPYSRSLYYSRAYDTYVFVYSLSRAYIPAAVSCGLVALALFCFLLTAAGRRLGAEGRTEIEPGFADRLPLEIFLALVLCPAYVGLQVSGNLGYSFLARLIVSGATLTLLVFLALACCYTLAVRVKARTLWHNTLLRRILGGLARLGCSLAASKTPARWLVLAYLLFMISLFFMVSSWDGFWTLLAILLVLASALLLLCLSNQLDRLRQGARALAQGDLEHAVDVSRMPSPLRQHGEDLNAAAGALNKAVNARLKSERMKTELITNVSHDIKTPLTSIINYVDLLKKAEPGSPETAEYFEVLERQTKRLKKLTEDVVEASKAATGNIAANLLPTNVDELLQQAAGEYEERLGQAQLPLVLNPLPLEASIMADGRLLSRVFDNLFANVAKYAQPQTRVYLGARLTGDNMLEISLKNVSREPLNLSPDELVERFVRGDSSRGSEGSGLGLSIAQSLVELQGGRFRLKIDGDLFTAVLLFPVL